MQYFEPERDEVGNITNINIVGYGEVGKTYFYIEDENGGYSFNAETGDVGYEFRRGKDKAEIYSLSFDYDSDFIACTSDRGTVHIFALTNSTPGDQNKEEENKDEEQTEGRKSKHVFQKIDKHEGFFGAISRLVTMPTGYMKAQRSFSQFRIPDVKPFSSFYGDCDNTKIFVISTEAKFYKIDFNFSIKIN